MSHGVNKDVASLPLKQVMSAQNLIAAGLSANMSFRIIMTIERKYFVGHNAEKLRSLDWSTASFYDFIDAYKVLPDPIKLKGVNFGRKSAVALLNFMKTHGYKES